VRKEGGAVSDRFHREPYKHPVPDALLEFMRQGWDDRDDPVDELEVAPRAADRRDRLATRFPGERLVIPAGLLTTRANDTDYRFRVDTAHVYLTGNQASDAVLVVEPDGSPTLYLRPRAAKTDDEFWRSGRYGEIWAGRRHSLTEAAALYGIATRHIAELPGALDGKVPTLVHRGVDAEIDQLVERTDDGAADAELAIVLSEMRLVKDDWEVAQLEDAIASTARGFDDCIAEWENALVHGERWIDGTFWRRARTDGNDIGYESIVACGPHATTLHWIDDDGPVTPGQLLLLDMGVENRSLYTADITRTLPVAGTFTAAQRQLYDLVLAAQEAGLAAVRPGAPFGDFHDAAQKVLAHGLSDMGLLPVSAEEALDSGNQAYKRWTLHGTGHMLGLDVHDCSAARTENYLEGKFEAGMVVTVEPGLYFQSWDLLVPTELRGTGVRIEDDVLVTSGGCRNLSAALPRSADDVESWLATGHS
jgi:Xaa-Pro aminopeptidase